MFNSRYNWQMANLSDQDQDQLDQLAEETGLPTLLLSVLKANGYHSQKAIDAFMSDQAKLHDPFLLYDMEKALARIQAAIMVSEPILIYGDYDADGITSTSLLYECLESMGANVTYYLPNRFEDGYGPNSQVYNYYIKQGIQLIITVDNGVAGFEAIANAQAAGVDVIVTDHHEIGDSLPDAHAIIHPRHPKGQYPFPDLAGVGVAFKLAQALMGDVPSEFLDLVAIGTVADLVSLRDENRSLVKMGIKQLQETDRLGLQEFYEREGIDPKTINEESIGFVIGPRLNALGRMRDPSPGLELLTAFDPDLIADRLELVEDTNSQRKEVVANMAEEVDQILTSRNHLPAIIILAQENWHQGVLGIVASRVVEKYQRPTILLAKDSDKQLLKGSARSVPGLDIFQLLSGAKEYAQAFGGHEMAAGMTISLADYPHWKDRLEELAKEQEKDILEKATLNIAQTITPSDVSLNTIHELKRLAPFGTDNPKPRFLLKDVELKQIQQLGKDKNTLKLTVKEGTKGSLPAIGFKKGDWAEAIDPDQKLDMVVELTINHWNGLDTPQALVVDIAQKQASVFDFRRAQSRQEVFKVKNAIYLFQAEKFAQAYQDDLPESSQAVLARDMTNMPKLDKDKLVLFDCIQDYEAVKPFINQQGINNLYLFAYSKDQAYLHGYPSKADFAKVYRYLSHHPNIPLKGAEEGVAKYLNLSLFHFKLIIQLLTELQLVQWQDGQCQVLGSQQKLDLKASKTWKNLQAQMKAERFLLYNESKDIKDYYFQED